MVTIFYSLFLTLIISSSVGAEENSFGNNGASSQKIQTFLFHVKTSLDEDDAQICVAPNVAWAALNKGHEVILIFDGSAVTSVKRGGFWNSTKTDMDRAKLPERERKALSQQFDYPLEQIPHNYGEYLHFLKKLGVKLYINRTMMLLYKIEPKEIDSSLEPIELTKMIELMEHADIYVAY
jgi:predicted peroxiredoxin